MLILDIDNVSIESTKKVLSTNFDTKDLGIANVILGIKIIHYNNNGIILTTLHYIKKNILKKFDHFDCKPITTHFDSNLKLYHKIG